MKLLAPIGLLILLSTSSNAQHPRPYQLEGGGSPPTSAPELDGSLAGAALAIVVGAVLIATQVRRRRAPAP